jgi:N-acetylneuraminic acid mutarotase
MDARCFDPTIPSHRGKVAETTAFKLLVTLAACGLLLGSLIGCVRGPSPIEGQSELASGPIATMHAAHNNAGTAVCADKLYVWSGYSDIPNAAHHDRTPVMEAYDPKTDTWSRGADVPGKCSGVGAFELDGMIYSVGGEGETSGTFTNSVYRYDPRTDTWTELGSFPTPIWDPLSVVCEGKAYVMGGRHGYGQTVPDVCEYDAPHDTWTKKADMPVPVMKAGVVAYDGRIYVFGGIQRITEDEVRRLSTVQVYDPLTDTWHCEADMPFRISHIGAVLFHDRMYVFAAVTLDEATGEWVENRFVYAYDPRRKEWSKHPYTPVVRTEGGTNVGVIDGWAYFTDTVKDGEKLRVACRVRLEAD